MLWLCYGFILGVLLIIFYFNLIFICLFLVGFMVFYWYFLGGFRFGVLVYRILCFWVVYRGVTR